MKDVVMISGVSQRTASRILYKIRKHYQKKPASFVTVDEFCAFTDIKEEVVREYVK
jgi:hypothetical protein